MATVQQAYRVINPREKSEESEKKNGTERLSAGTDFVQNCTERLRQEND